MLLPIKNLVLQAGKTEPKPFPTHSHPCLLPPTCTDPHPELDFKAAHLTWSAKYYSKMFLSHPSPNQNWPAWWSQVLVLRPGRITPLMLKNYFLKLREERLFLIHIKSSSHDFLCSPCSSLYSTSFNHWDVIDLFSLVWSKLLLWLGLGHSEIFFRQFLKYLVVNELSYPKINLESLQW